MGYYACISDVPATKSSSSMPSTPSIKKVSKISTSCSSTVLNNANLQWSCTKCTFLNHPALKVCEECEMPRFSEEITETNDCICHGVQ